MFKHPFTEIVVGIDFSVYSKIVVKQALKLSHLWKAKLILVHALNEPAAPAPNFFNSLQKSLGPLEYSEKIKGFYGLKSLSYGVVVDFSAPARLLLNTAKRFKRPLIVVGYKGHHPITEFLFGSTAQNVALDSKSPVWVHRGRKTVEPKKVLVPHDLTNQSNRGIEYLKKLKLLNPGSYKVFFVREKPFPVLDYELYSKMERDQVKQVQRGLRKLLSKYPRLDIQEASGDATEKIVQKTRDFDLILISHRQEKDFYSSSETKRLMRTSDVPLMVV